MIETASVVKSAKHAGINLALIIAIGIIMVAGTVAWDTKFGTKPLTWFNAKQQVAFDPTAY